MPQEDRKGKERRGKERKGEERLQEEHYDTYVLNEEEQIPVARTKNNTTKERTNAQNNMKKRIITTYCKHCVSNYMIAAPAATTTAVSSRPCSCFFRL